MNCVEYRKQALLVEGQANLPEDLRLHFADCPGCRRHVQEQEHLRLELRKLADSEQAPQALRQRVAQVFRRPLVPERQGISRWVAVAAAILLMLGAGAGYLWYEHARTLSPERLAREFINDHLHYLPGREQILSGSPEQVEGWFRGRVDFPVRVPNVPNAALQDARVCDISGRKAALLHYRHNPGEALISVFVAEEPEAFDRQMKSDTLVASNEGLNSTLWCHRGLVYDVVAPLDDATLGKIAESLRKQLP